MVDDDKMWYENNELPTANKEGGEKSDKGKQFFDDLDKLEKGVSKEKDSVSSITITKNTKGLNWEIKVYASSDDKELETLRDKTFKLMHDMINKIGQ